MREGGGKKSWRKKAVMESRATELNDGWMVSR